MMIGPTTHVLNRSPLSCALWHPCGIQGNCLVSITSDAVVRLWELDPNNRWSFDSPSLAVDLTRLAKGQTAQDDFSPPKDSSNRTFSAENVDLDIASACFGGIADPREDVWSAMTLWVATKFGTLYALCPFLPRKWCSSSSALRSVSTDLTLKLQVLCSDDSENVDQAENQLKWTCALDEQDEHARNVHMDSEATKVYSRPDMFGAVPKLQGPFAVATDENDEDIELSDVYVIPSSYAGGILEASMEEDDDATDLPPSPSFTTICLVSRVGRVYLCPNLRRIEAMWLPQRSSTFTVPDDDEEVIIDYHLTPFEILDTLNPLDADDAEWPTITRDTMSSEGFFLTHSMGVHYISVSPWAQALEDELKSGSTEGLSTRLDILRQSAVTVREQIIQFQSDIQDGFNSSPSASLVIDDSDLGYLLLTVHESAPHLARFSTSSQSEGHFYIKPDPDAIDSDVKPIPQSQHSSSLIYNSPPHTHREIYTPSAMFSRQSSLLQHLGPLSSITTNNDQGPQSRNSSATLAGLSSVHRDISAETAALGASVADLFVTCHRLQEGLRDQIHNVRHLNERISRVAGKDSDEYAGRIGGGGINEEVQERVERAETKQEELMNRLNRLRHNMSSLGGQDKKLSKEEEKWIHDMQSLAGATLGKNAIKYTLDHDDAHNPSEENIEDDVMLPHMRAKATPEGDAQSSSSDDESQDDEQYANEDSPPRRPTSQSLQDRHNQAHDLAQALIAEVPKGSSFNESMASFTSSMSSTISSNRWGEGVHVPQDTKKRRMREIMAMIDRETALVDATTGRLERLKVAAAVS